MDRREKAEKKEVISNSIDLSNGRYKDYEIDTLYDIVTNRDDYIGQSHTYHETYTDWSSDGKYTRERAYTYTMNGDDGRISINMHCEYHDDDGASGSYDSEFTTGRDILNNLDKLFGE